MDYKQLVNDLGICASNSCEGCSRGAFGCSQLKLDAAVAIEDLLAELAAEKHRHDLLQDFEVAEAQELARVKAELAARDNPVRCRECLFAAAISDTDAWCNLHLCRFPAAGGCSFGRRNADAGAV